MPIAFTEKQQLHIAQSLCDAAKELLVNTPYYKIKIDQLTKAVGISKGAFYKFYPTKEQFFYQLLRSLHEEMYTPIFTLLKDPAIKTAEEYICQALLQCYGILKTSKYKRFWLEDSQILMEAISQEEKAKQHEVQKQIMLSALKHFGELAVDEDVALEAIWTLITTVYSKKTAESNYETILCWMTQGVCHHIFK